MAMAGDNSPWLQQAATAMTTVAADATRNGTECSGGPGLLAWTTRCHRVTDGSIPGRTPRQLPVRPTRRTAWRTVTRTAGPTVTRTVRPRPGPDVDRGRPGRGPPAPRGRRPGW